MRTTTGSTVLRVAGALWILSGVWYLMTEFVVAQHLPGYSYSTNYISDLGRPPQSPMAAWMNGAFISQGVAFAVAGAVAAATMRPGSRTFVGFALAYGAGSLVVGVVPSGGTGALLHVGGATAAILGGNLAVTTAGVVLFCRRRFRLFALTSVALGVAGLLSAAVLLCSSAFGAQVVFGDGAWERAAIYTIIGWQLLAGVAVLIPFRRPQRVAGSGAEPTVRP